MKQSKWNINPVGSISCKLQKHVKSYSLYKRILTLFSQVISSSVMKLCFEVMKGLLFFFSCDLQVVNKLKALFGSPG